MMVMMTTCDLDCDDFDGNSTTRLTDADCDGVITLEDCDDTDETAQYLDKIAPMYYREFVQTQFMKMNQIVSVLEFAKMKHIRQRVNVYQTVTALRGWAGQANYYPASLREIVPMALHIQHKVL